MSDTKELSEELREHAMLSRGTDGRSWFDQLADRAGVTDEPVRIVTVLVDAKGKEYLRGSRSFPGNQYARNAFTRKEPPLDGWTRPGNSRITTPKSALEAERDELQARVHKYEQGYAPDISWKTAFEGMKAERDNLAAQLEALRQSKDPDSTIFIRGEKNE